MALRQLPRLSSGASIKMASRMKRSISPETTEEDGFVFICDRRKGKRVDTKLSTGGLFTYEDFKSRVCELLAINPKSKFVITTTNREEVCSDETWDFIDSSETLYILEDVNQELFAPAQEQVNYLPHYDTIVKGGMYEYYASEGQNPLPFAFAELIDNALAATVDNKGERRIEIVLHVDEASPSKSSVFIMDNGKGMNSRQLNNWAIYRLSKFTRKEKTMNASIDEDHCYTPKPMPRSLNSDISYFGVGGKQAIFFIGNSTSMITKTADSNDVHELSISKEEFERKEQNKESIYKGFIRNRKVGDCSHVASEDEQLQKIIKEEEKRQSFTVVVIQGLNPDHVPYMKTRFKEWTRQLSHIYHYYIHGPNGNTLSKTDDDKRFNNISIEVTMHTKKERTPQTVNLRDVADDMQSLFVQSAARTFEFKATVAGAGMVEGLIRYHPFLFDKETYPPDYYEVRVDNPDDDEDDYVPPARGKRPIFECYWNGRLIPYTTILEFDWCSPPKKLRFPPAECFNRISGVLFSNDKFQVSTNKLTFTDLELKLKDKNTAFSVTVMGQDKRTAMESSFINWLKECHEQCDKQIRFTGFQGTISRPELPKAKQGPWGVFKQVEWDGKVFKAGQLVRLIRLVPIIYGRINRFFLHGEYDGAVYATGGEIEISQEPISLHDNMRVLPLTKLDQNTTQAQIKKYIDEEEAKLPSKLDVTFPEGLEVRNNQKKPAGFTVGAIKVNILNRKGEEISKLPGSRQGKLLVELKLICHDPLGDQELVSHISQFGKSWGYWFRKMENVKNLGDHTLILQVVLNESGANRFAEKELPRHSIQFTVIEGEPNKFTVGLLDGPFRVGTPFNIPLEVQDEFGNPTKPTSALKPSLETSGLELNYKSTCIKGNTLVIQDIVAEGDIQSVSGKSYNLAVKVSGLKREVQTLKIRLLPGAPSELIVTPETCDVENGQSVEFQVSTRDISGNVTTQPNLIAVCKFTGADDLPSYRQNISHHGEGCLSGLPITIKKMKGEAKITATITLQGLRSVPAVTRMITVSPSTSPASMQLSYEREGRRVQIDNGQELLVPAGEILTGFEFIVKDEAGREITLDSKRAGDLKVNWTNSVNKDLVTKGQLPDTKVPNSVSDVKYCQVSYKEVEVSFSIKPVTNEVASITCCCSASNKLRAGEKLAGSILVNVQDKFGNAITKLPKGVLKDLQISGDHLIVENTLRGLGQSGGFDISGIEFDDGEVGMREVCVTYKQFKEYVKLEMLPGPPAKINVLDWDETEVLHIFNDTKLPKALTVQLCDKSGNPCKEEGVQVQVARDAQLKLHPPLKPDKTDKNGKAKFEQPIVSAKKGTYEIQPKAFLKRTTINGPRLKIRVEPDLEKPMDLKVEFVSGKEFIAGSPMPHLKIYATAEDGSTISTTKMNHFSMVMWMKDQVIPAQKKFTFAPDTKTDGGFLFTKPKAMTVAGMYNILFSYKDAVHPEVNMPMVVEVVGGPPVKLVPTEAPGTPSVSNTQKALSRSLIRNLTLELRDSHNNPSGSDVSGKVDIEIIDQANDGEIPSMTGNSRRLTIDLQNGKANLHNIMLQENTPGRDGHEYILRCKATSSTHANIKNVAHYDIPFLFYNDAKKQAQVAALCKEKDCLKKAIRTYKNLFETTQMLIDELKVSVHESNTEVTRLKNELKKQNVQLNQIGDMTGVDKLVQTRVKERDGILNMPRRLCGLAHAPKDSDVIGKICHLAFVEDHDIARVLSWHMSADMDCVVTTSTKKAKDIYQQSGGKQQVLPLDSVFKKSITIDDWNTKPLPHVRYRGMWKPAGNPVYARQLLSFPQHQDACRTVFGLLLGDTIILDTLDHANSYRKEVVKFCYCPTILTRTGDRIRSNGKFGGFMNKAVPLEKLRGVVFSEPLPKTYHAVCTQIDTLQAFRAALVKQQNSKLELDEHMQSQNDPEMREKQRECQESEEQMRNIEEKLVNINQPSPVRPIPSAMSLQASATSSARVASKRNAATPVRFSDVASTPKRARGAAALASPVTNGNTSRQSPRVSRRK